MGASRTAAAVCGAACAAVIVPIVAAVAYNAWLNAQHLQQYPQGFDAAGPGATDTRADDVPDHGVVKGWFDDTYAGEEGTKYLRHYSWYDVYLNILNVTGRHAGTTVGGGGRGLDDAGGGAGKRHLGDIACGLGHILRVGHEAGLEVHGVDISDSAVAAVRKALPNVDVQQGVAEELPWADASMDFVTCIGALERFLDRRAALAEMRRVLKPGGKLVILVRNCEAIEWAVHVATGGVETSARQQALLMNQWIDLFEANGLRVDDVLPDQYYFQRLHAARKALTPGFLSSSSSSSLSQPSGAAPDYDGYDLVRLARGGLPMRLLANSYIFVLADGEAEAAAAPQQEP